MPRKPTEPFGSITFGENGNINAQFARLPDIKALQEEEIGRRFAAEMRRITGKAFESKALKENDHDFQLITEQTIIDVQATEIVARDYLRPLPLEDYLNGQHSFTYFVCNSPEEILGVDMAAKEEVLLSRIQKKIGKHYSKEKTPLWLLVWTVCSDYFLFWNEGGKPYMEPCVIKVHEYLAAHGSGPFDEIWFFYPDIGRPHKIWPSG